MLFRSLAVGGNDLIQAGIRPGKELGSLLKSLLSQVLDEWLYRCPKPTFWRALTDNDRGSKFHIKSGSWLSADMFIDCKGIPVSYTHLSPLAVAKYSKEAGYSVDGSGSSWTLISEGCKMCIRDRCYTTQQVRAVKSA